MTIDLNADLGESFGSWQMGADEQLLAIVTTANVACGFHAGDPSVMLRTLESCVNHGVAIGAHVAYRDLAGFGRRFIDIDPRHLFADVLYQISALAGMATSVGAKVTHVKPHGALYNAIATHESQAQAVVDAIVAFDSDLIFMGLPGSVAMQRASWAGLTTVAEGFVDRSYTEDWQLVPRSQQGAVLHDPEAVTARLREWLADETLTRFQSLCVHGDTPGAVDLARGVRGTLTGAGIDVRSFA